MANAAEEVARAVEEVLRTQGERLRERAAGTAQQERLLGALEKAVEQLELSSESFGRTRQEMQIDLVKMRLELDDLKIWRRTLTASAHAERKHIWRFATAVASAIIGGAFGWFASLWGHHPMSGP